MDSIEELIFDVILVLDKIQAGKPTIAIDECFFIFSDMKF